MDFIKNEYYACSNELEVQCVQVSNCGAWMEKPDHSWFYVDTFGETKESEWNIMSPIQSIDRKEEEPTVHNAVTNLGPYQAVDLKPESSNESIADHGNLPGIDNTKAVKFDAGKPKMTLVPPRALVEVAKAMTYGAKKYAADNYLNGGFTQRQLMDSAYRHLNSHLQGEDIDESGNTHLSHAAASIMMLIECIMTDRIKDDRWKK